MNEGPSNRAIPGIADLTHSLLERNPKPTDEEILEALDGNLCRCTGYVKKLTAIQRAARELGEGRDE